MAGERREFRREDPREVAARVLNASAIGGAFDDLALLPDGSVGSAEEWGEARRSEVAERVREILGHVPADLRFWRAWSPVAVVRFAILPRGSDVPIFGARA